VKPCSFAWQGFSKNFRHEIIPSDSCASIYGTHQIVSIDSFTASGSEV
jgi:hypothetical protein